MVNVANQVGALPGHGMPKQTRVERVVADLSGRIVRGALQPGDRLTELALVDELGVGRSTIREALQRLALIGFLVGESHRGYSVRAFTSEDAIGIGEVFTILEQRAVETVTFPVDPTVADQMRAAAEAMKPLELPDDIDRICELDRVFHGSLVDACSSPWIKDAWRRQGPLLKVMVVPLLRSGENSNQCQRHLDLLAEVESGDVRRIKEALALHYRQAH